MREWEWSDNSPPVYVGGNVSLARSWAGPRRTDDVELRASWTPAEDDLRGHAEAFCTLVSTAAGLPPVGIAQLAR